VYCTRIPFEFGFEDHGCDANVMGTYPDSFWNRVPLHHHDG
jgi:hypothetical protein